MSETDIIFAFSIIVIAGVLAGRFADENNFPRTIPLVITGILLAAINALAPEPLIVVKDIHEITLFIAEMALIVILFKEGMHLNIRETTNYFGTIFSIATVGIVIKTFIIGIIATLIFSIITLFVSPPPAVTLTLTTALLLGAIFTPTDPAATFSILRSGDTKIKEKFETILGGESAFNDVFAILLVVIVFIPLVESELLGSAANLTVNEILLTIIWQFVGGAIIGLLIGLLYLKFIKRMQNYLEESFISFSAVALIFVIGYITNTSPAIGALIAGFVFANPTIFKQADYFKRPIFRFWDGVTWIFELFAFILVGGLFSILEIRVELLFFGMILSFIVIVGRFLGIFLITLPLELKESTKEHFNTNERLFVAFAGMKGLTTAILALLAFITLDFNLELAEIILDSTLMVLLMTGLFQSLFLKSFAKRTGVLEEYDELEEIITERIVLTAKLEHLVEEFSQEKISADQYRSLSIPIKERLIGIRDRIVLLRAESEYRHQMIHLLENQNEYAQKALAEAREKNEIDDNSYRRALEKLKQEYQDFTSLHRDLSKKRE
ncbi:MAG: cation:proton antiporter [Candidatus Thorarchaeota archaeon]